MERGSIDTKGVTWENRFLALTADRLLIAKVRTRVRCYYRRHPMEQSINRTYHELIVRLRNFEFVFCVYAVCLPAHYPVLLSLRLVLRLSVRFCRRLSHSLYL
jgi:hypothetical protein